MPAPFVAFAIFVVAFIFIVYCICKITDKEYINLAIASPLICLLGVLSLWFALYCAEPVQVLSIEYFNITNIQNKNGTIRQVAYNDSGNVEIDIAWYFHAFCADSTAFAVEKTTYKASYYGIFSTDLIKPRYKLVPSFIAKRDR